tara:strand:+ start:2536 stop:3195 length:660 start_codon:yes stop_codon:yes gene_type:complete
MSVLPRRFRRIKNVLDSRMGNLTVLVEGVNKPHNLSAILRTCDAAGVYKAHFVCQDNHIKTFNSTAQGSQKWVKLKNHKTYTSAAKDLKKNGFKLYGTSLNKNSIDYRKLDLTKNTCFVLGAEKWGLSKEMISMVDESIYIPMHGMVQSLNVSVAAAILLFEAIRQRNAKNLIPSEGEGLNKEEYKNTLFEWTHPEIAISLKKSSKNYPYLDANGEIDT